MLRVVQWVMLGSIVTYASLGQMLGRTRSDVDPTISYILSSIGVAVVGMIFVVRRTLVFPAQETLTQDRESLVGLNHWKTGYIATYALCEALSLTGLVLRLTGFDFLQSLPFYVGGFVLLAFFRPKLPAANA